MSLIEKGGYSLGRVYLSWGQPLCFNWLTVMIALAISARAWSNRVQGLAVPGVLDPQWSESEVIS